MLGYASVLMKTLQAPADLAYLVRATQGLDKSCHNPDKPPSWTLAHPHSMLRVGFSGAWKLSTWTDSPLGMRAWLHVCRYLGLLHMEVFHQRLDQEYGASIITTTPTVPYSLKLGDGSTEEIQNPSQVAVPTLHGLHVGHACPGHRPSGLCTCPASPVPFPARSG